MSQPENKASTGQRAAAIEAVEDAKTAVDKAWAATANAMDRMREAGVPVLVVERLGDARLRLNDTREYTEVLTLLRWRQPS